MTQVAKKDRVIQILSIISVHGKATNQMLSDRLHLDRQTVKGYLAKMRKAGLIYPRNELTKARKTIPNEWVEGKEPERSKEDKNKILAMKARMKKIGAMPKSTPKRKSNIPLETSQGSRVLHNSYIKPDVKHCDLMACFFGMK